MAQIYKDEAASFFENTAVGGIFEPLRREEHEGIFVSGFISDFRFQISDLVRRLNHRDTRHRDTQEIIFELSVLCNFLDLPFIIIWLL
jgi:hypothetical protein